MKTLFYNTLLLFFLLGVFNASAQQQLYGFSLRGTGEFLTLSDAALTMSGQRTGVNKLSQYFIVKRLSNGSVLIAVAAKPTLFLKRNITAVEAAVYIDGDSSFEWQLGYSGYPYISLRDPLTGNVVSWHGGSGFTMEPVSAALSDNADPLGDHYRFGLTTVTNTF